MAGIAVELIVSWILLWFICKKHLSVLGLSPTKMRVAELAIGLLLAAACCTVYQLMTTAFIDNGWVANKQATLKAILEKSRWTLVSVLYEDMIFRGALLYIAIQRLGIAKACFLSAIAFGIYHWFTFNVLGNPLMMVVTFLMTALVGLSWAFAFAKTSSLYLPIGLHLGWNLIGAIVFSKSPSAQAILVKVNAHQAQGLLSLLIFLFQVAALPLVTFWYLSRISARRKITVGKDQMPLTDAVH